MSKRIIVLSGSHRSGSTWGGKMIALADNVFYVDEPFNVGKMHYKSPISEWLLDPQYQSVEKQNKIKNYLSDLAESPSFLLKYNLYHLVKRNRKKFVNNPFSNIQELFSHYKKSKLPNSIPIFKDPIAVLGLEWIDKNFDAKIIVIIRHPAAFITSTVLRKWQFDACELLKQKELIENHFSSLLNEVLINCEKKGHFLDNNILAWNMIHSRIMDYKNKNKHWYFVRHEDLSLNPVREFEKIYNFLDLNFTDEIKTKIIEFTTKGGDSYYHRNSAENVLQWKSKLSASEIEIIKRKTAPFWKEFYDEKDW